MAIVTIPTAGREPNEVRPRTPVGRSMVNSRSRRVKDNLTGHAFLIGAVFCFALFAW